MFSSHKMRWFLGIIILVLISFVVARVLNHLTDGFFIWNIQYDYRAGAEWEVHPLTTTEKAKVAKILSQKFTYLSKGHHTFVFASEDGKYVLKFIKNHVIHPKPWLTYLPASYKDKRLKRMDTRRDILLTGWKTSFDDLPEETGIIAMSITRHSGFTQPVTLIDKMGNSFQVNLDETAFYLQKRTKILSDVLESDIAEGKIEQAKELLNKLVILYKSEFDRGIAEEDIFILRNTGVTEEGNPVQIDVGRLYHTQGKIPDYRAELMRKTVLMRKWLEEKNPELAAYFESLL